MKTSHIRMRVVCAAAAFLLTGLSSTVFVSAEPRTFERSATPVVASGAVETKSAAS